MQHSRSNPTIWDKRRDKHDHLWPQKLTWRPVVALLNETAKASGQRVVRPHRAIINLQESKTGGGLRIDGPIPMARDLQESEQFDVKSILARLDGADREAVLEGRAIPEPIIKKYAHEIHAAIRGVRYATYARIAIKRDVKVKKGKKVRRTVLIAWGHQDAKTSEQLRRLADAVSGSAFKWDKAWLGLTDDARRYLHVGLAEARRLGALQDFKGELEKRGDILLAAVPTPEFAQVALAHAIQLVPRTGRPPKIAENETLAAILDIFVMLTTPREVDRNQRGMYAKLLEDGIPFVRRIEEIFEIKGSPKITLLPKHEEDAIKKARPLMESLPQRLTRRPAQRP